MKIIIIFLILVVFLVYPANARTTAYWLEDCFDKNDLYIGRYIVEYNLETNESSKSKCPSNTVRLIIPSSSMDVQVFDDIDRTLYLYAEGEFKSYITEPSMKRPEGNVFAYSGGLFYYNNSNSIFTANTNWDKRLVKVLYFNDESSLFAPQPSIAIRNRFIITESFLDEHSDIAERITVFMLDNEIYNIKRRLLLYPIDTLYSRTVLPLNDDDYIVFSCVRDQLNSTKLMLSKSHPDNLHQALVNDTLISNLPGIAIGGCSYSNSLTWFGALVQEEYNILQERYYDAIYVFNLCNGEYYKIKKFDFGPCQWIEESYILIIDE